MPLQFKTSSQHHKGSSCSLLLTLSLFLITLLPLNAQETPTSKETPPTLDDPARYYPLAQQAWKEGRYRLALDHYATAHPTNPPASVLYNIGNCYYRMDEPGLAALHYHRALYKSPRHPEATQNLALLTAKYNIPTPQIHRAQELLATAPKPLYHSLRHLGLWLLPLSILGVITFRRSLPLGIASGTSGLIIIGLATTALHFYPTDPTRVPNSEKAIVNTSQPTITRSEPHRAAAPLSDLPPGTLCQLLAPRGNWSYIQLPDETRAWLPTNELSPLIPPPDHKENNPAPKGYF